MLLAFKECYNRVGLILCPPCYNEREIRWKDEKLDGRMRNLDHIDEMRNLKHANEKNKHTIKTPTDATSYFEDTN